MDMATTQFALARALWGVGKAKTRALELARTASAGFDKLGKRGAQERKEVEAWLAKRAAPQ